jgi:O-antigen ligase
VDSAIELLKLVLFYLIIADVVNSEKKFKVFMNAFAYLTMLVAGIAILQRFDVDLLRVGMAKPDRIQGAGIFNNPNYLAYYTCIAFPVFFHQIRLEKTFFPRLFGLLGVIISCWAIIWTKSRGGMLCAAFTIILCFTQGRKLWVKNLFLILGLTVFLVSFSLLPRLATLSKGDSTIQDRIDAWHSGWEMMKAHPVIGVGLGQFNDYHKGKTSHSTFVRIGSESGILGLITWCAMLFAAFKLLLRTKYMNERYKKYYIILEASMWAYMFSNFSADLAMIVIILSGMVGALSRLNLQYQNIYVKSIAEQKKRASTAKKISNSLNFRRLDALGVISFMLFLLIFWHLTVRFRF